MATDWVVDKSRVAFYALGDSSRQTEVPNIVTEDAITFVEDELEKLRIGLSTSAIRTDKSLNLALVYYACYLMVKAGITTQRSGVVTSEGMDTLSISYEGTGVARKQITKANPPQDFMGMANDAINRYAEKTIKAHRTIGFVTRNKRADLLGGIYNKNHDDYKYGRN